MGENISLSLFHLLTPSHSLSFECVEEIYFAD